MCEVCLDKQNKEGQEIGTTGAVEREQELNADSRKQEVEKENTGLDIIDREKLRQHRELEQYKEHIAGMRGICGLCRIQGERWDHSFSECRGMQEVVAAKREVRRQLERKGRAWIQGYKACFWCLNPQKICRRAGGEGKDAVGCEFPDVVLPICYGIWSQAGGRAWIEEEFKRRFEDTGEYMEWLGSAGEFGGTDTIRG